MGQICGNHPNIVIVPANPTAAKTLAGTAIIADIGLLGRRRAVFIFLSNVEVTGDPLEAACDAGMFVI